MRNRDGLVEWCQQQRAMLTEQLKMMRMGTLKTFERQESGLPMADTTVMSMDRLERQIARLDEIMARCSNMTQATSAAPR